MEYSCRHGLHRPKRQRRGKEEIRRNRRQEKKVIQKKVAELKTTEQASHNSLFSKGLKKKQVGTPENKRTGLGYQYQRQSHTSAINNRD